MDRPVVVIVIVTRRGVITAAGFMTKSGWPGVDEAGLGTDSGQRLIKPAR